MKNLMLYLMTVCAYFGIYAIWTGSAGFNATDIKALGLIAILALPINIGGNVFTVIGNAESEKSIYALCSLYQKAGDWAVNIIGLCSWQCAEGNGANAVTILGLPLYQRASGWAVTIAGIVIYQSADDTAVNIAGASGYQKGGRSAGMIVGYSIYQNAGREAVTIIGFTIYQKVTGKSRAMGAIRPLISDKIT